MNYRIQEIEGIGPANAARLAAAGIDSNSTLLRPCCTGAGRKAVAGKTGVPEAQLLKWANMADLMRISGIGAEFSELPEAVGVDTVKELRAQRGQPGRPDARSESPAEAHAHRPIGQWVDQAAQLTPMITQ